ncbi:MAG: inorganic phosphate transporter family protein [Bacteroidetes bacterium]|nr:inorganic phosphate transporter family protein [Bacteroidota bacterium]
MTILIVIIVLALLFDYINGFHDAANSIATVVSTKVLTPLQAVIWAAFFNFVAFFIFKDHAVANTIGKTVHSDFITLQVIFSGLIAAIAWNLLTWWYGIPSSSSHTLIGGFAGAALMNAFWNQPGLDFEAIVAMDKISKTLFFIFLAPLIGMTISAFITLVTIQQNLWLRTSIIVASCMLTWFAFDYFEQIKMAEVAQKVYGSSVDWSSHKDEVRSLIRGYDEVGAEGLAAQVALLFPGSEPALTSKLSKSLSSADNSVMVWGIMAVALLFVLTFWYVEKFTTPTAYRVGDMFKKLQLLSSAAFSVGHGGNDAQKVMGIIAAAMVANGDIEDIKNMPDWVPLACYSAIGLGTLSGGWKIIKTMGTKITKVTPLEGVCAETSGALTLFMTEQMGIPVSTTHTITGSIIGVGATKRLSAVRWGVTIQLLWAWVLTIPISALLAGLVLLLVRSLS